jgi:hypothetical protein
MTAAVTVSIPVQLPGEQNPDGPCTARDADSFPLEDAYLQVLSETG